MTGRALVKARVIGNTSQKRLGLLTSLRPTPAFHTTSCLWTYAPSPPLEDINISWPTACHRCCSQSEFDAHIHYSLKEESHNTRCPVLPLSEPRIKLSNHFLALASFGIRLPNFNRGYSTAAFIKRRFDLQYDLVHFCPIIHRIHARILPYSSNKSFHNTKTLD